MSMNNPFRIVAWNCHGASLGSRAWDYLLELDPDVALLQETRKIPPVVLATYAWSGEPAVMSSGAPTQVQTGVLVKGEIIGDIPMPAPSEWIARELEISRGNLIAKRVRLRSGLVLKVISVYSQATPIDRSRLVGVDTTDVQLAQCKDVWSTEILWASLREMGIAGDEPFVVGGDFNSCETLDPPASGNRRGNREGMERMNALGFRDCLRTCQGWLVPAFRWSDGSVIHQLDYLYATEAMLGNLVGCDVGSAERVFGSIPRLSDHLPIVADFNGAQQAGRTGPGA